MLPTYTVRSIYYTCQFTYTFSLLLLPSFLPPTVLVSLSLSKDVGMPAEYVNKLARMFQDIKVSQDLNTEFKERQRGSSMAGESLHHVRVM